MNAVCFCTSRESSRVDNNAVVSKWISPALGVECVKDSFTSNALRVDSTAVRYSQEEWVATAVTNI
uniref:Predicted protein n=1 Tax=Hordeum vulgare subsp. vulgare TaxID=112509 RepID=F2E4Z5_HORVV|nr:predicted protein [Hordeum vulgare subsp. vulgare]